MKAQPLRVFIASASEGLEVAKAVRQALQEDESLQPILWNEGTFKPSLTFIESLESELAQSDFAVLTLTPDDQSSSRGQLRMEPRDNVLFELGLFMGRLGRERTYFVYDKGRDLKIPTDLLGVNPATYICSDQGNLLTSIRPACSLLATRMKELGPRLTRPSEDEAETKLVADFCQRIVGSWWGRQWPSQGGDIRLSLFKIAPDGGSYSVRANGQTFDKTGALYGKWQTVAIGIHAGERSLVHAWEGTHPTLSPGETFAGFGQYTFDAVPGIYTRAEGYFADTRKGGKKSIGWTSVEVKRVDPASLERITNTMENGSDNERADEVVKMLNSFVQHT
jgi:hypothetical protein